MGCVVSLYEDNGIVRETFVDECGHYGGGFMADIILVEQVQEKIYLIRGQKVMLASDLAKLYMVETFNLNKAVKRNINRFPEDFMFQLTREEADSLKFQIGMSNQSRITREKYRKQEVAFCDLLCARLQVFFLKHPNF